jgi:hypothetical protein
LICNPLDRKKCAILRCVLEKKFSITNFISY